MGLAVIQQTSYNKMKLTKPLFIIGTVLLVYGFICRLADIYFFWDSKTIGFYILLLALLGYLFSLYRKRKLQLKKTIWVKIAIGFLSLLLVMVPIVLGVMMNSDAYKAAKSQIRINPSIQQKIGKVKGFGILTTGQINTKTINGTLISGEALFSFTIKGEKKFVDATVTLTKDADNNWRIISIE